LIDVLSGTFQGRATQAVMWQSTMWADIVGEQGEHKANISHQY